MTKYAIHRSSKLGGKMAEIVRKIVNKLDPDSTTQMYTFVAVVLVVVGNIVGGLLASLLGNFTPIEAIVLTTYSVTVFFLSFCLTTFLLRKGEKQIEKKEIVKRTSNIVLKIPFIVHCMIISFVGLILSFLLRDNTSILLRLLAFGLLLACLFFFYLLFVYNLHPN